MKDDPVALLDEVLPLVRFQVYGFGRSVDLGTYRHGYAESQTFMGIQRRHPTWFVHAEVDVGGVAEAQFARLVAAVRCLLGSHVDPGTSRVVCTAPTVMGGGMYPRPDIHRFTRQIVRCAALAGSARTMELLRGWVQGKPIHYTQMIVLQGIHQDQERLDLQPGVRLMRLSRDDGLFKVIPEELAIKALDSIVDTALPGATVLCVDTTASPAIYKPSDAAHDVRDVARHSALQHPTSRLLQALSLACENPVGAIHSWLSFDSELALLTGCRNPLHSWPVRWAGGSVALTQGHLDRARDLCDKLTRQPSSELQVAVQRWMKSKPLLDLVNDSIDIRIALESLFYQEGEITELSLRLALRGAWYLGNDKSQRVEYFKTLKKAYDACSKAVHTGSLKGKESTHRELLTDAQDLCRKAILKRLDTGGTPDWTKLVLDA